ncbi:MAG: PDGLE domain-containing protein, partial [Thermomicrobium sp.]|nr:PDGLE domain-containing protein [Thermomicrobium sp.]
LPRPTASVRGDRRALLVLLAAVVVLLTPLGLVATDPAWGEWSAEELETLVGYVPSGLAGWEGWWRAPLPDYSLPWLASEASFLEQALAYVLSAIVGIGLISAAVLALRLVLRPRSPQDRSRAAA